MKIVYSAFLVLLLMPVGCASSNIEPYSIRPMHSSWKNLYENDPDLAGIAVILEGSSELGYIGKHPPGIIYLFWDGKIYQTQHNPDGSIISGGWSDTAINPDSKIWNYVDYSFGSDPDFQRHDDPRTAEKRGISGQP